MTEELGAIVFFLAMGYFILTLVGCVDLAHRRDALAELKKQNNCPCMSCKRCIRLLKEDGKLIAHCGFNSCVEATEILVCSSYEKTGQVPVHRTQLGQSAVHLRRLYPGRHGLAYQGEQVRRTYGEVRI